MFMGGEGRGVRVEGERDGGRRKREIAGKKQNRMERVRE